MPETPVLTSEYPLDPVELTGGDIEWLWAEATRLFEPGTNGVKLRFNEREIRLRVSDKNGQETFSNTDAAHLLKSGLLGDHVSELRMNLLARYSGPDGKSRGANRQLRLRIGEQGSNTLSVTGEPDWIATVHASIKRYLEKKKRTVWGVRAMAFASVWIFPMVVLFSAGYHFQELNAGGAVVLFLLAAISGYALLGNKLREWYPATVIQIEDLAGREPSFLKFARELFLATLAAAIIAVAFALV